jgi:phosphate:Na+ symporter
LEHVLSGTELFLTFLGAVGLLLWGVRMVQTGITRAFGTVLRRALSLYAVMLTVNGAKTF